MSVERSSVTNLVWRTWLLWAGLHVSYEYEKHGNNETFLKPVDKYSVAAVCCVRVEVRVHGNATTITTTNVRNRTH